MEYQRKVSFAIVGCGLIGHRRLGTLPDGSLKYACDVNEERARHLAAATTNCAPTGDLDAVLHDSNVDAIIVATANAALAPVTLRAVKAGKHVLVEKPGGISSRELSEIESAAVDSGALVRIGYNHRFHPGFCKAYELVQQGDLGDVMFVRGRYGHGGRTGYDREWRMDPAQSGGGELIDQGVHLIDLAASFLGEFTAVDGHAATYFWDTQVDDNAFLSLRTRAGRPPGYR